MFFSEVKLRRLISQVWTLAGFKYKKTGKCDEFSSITRTFYISMTHVSGSCMRPTVSFCVLLSDLILFQFWEISFTTYHQLCFSSGSSCFADIFPSWRRVPTWSSSWCLLRSLPSTETQRPRGRSWTGRTGPNCAKTARSLTERTSPAPTWTSSSPKSSESADKSWVQLKLGLFVFCGRFLILINTEYGLKLFSCLNLLCLCMGQCSSPCWWSVTLWILQ